MNFFSFWKRNKTPPPGKLQDLPLSPTLQWMTLGLLWVGLLPLLYALPFTLTILLTGIGGAISVLALQKPLPFLFRLAVVLFLIFAVIYLQLGVGDFKSMAMAVIVSIMIMKSTEIHTPRDSIGVILFSLIGPSSAFLLKIEPWITWPCIFLTFFGCFMLFSALLDWKERKPYVLWKDKFKKIGHLGLYAIPLGALLLFGLPSLQTTLQGWGQSQRAEGLQTQMTPGAWGTLFDNPETAFRVTFEGDAPLPPFYFKGFTLSTYDGQTWNGTPAIPGEPLPPFRPTPTTNTPSYRYFISMERTRQMFLYSLEQPRSWPSELMDLQPDGSLRAKTSIEQERRFGPIVSQSFSLSYMLPDHERYRYLQLPKDYNPQTQALIQQWRSDGLTDAQIIEKTLQWFGQEFAYSYDPPPLTRHQVDDFLFNTKTGYCQHFSSSFAVMMRMAGIPSRVVLGYAGGEWNAMGKYWRIPQSNAHAWNEVFINNQWLRIDPTAMTTHNGVRPQDPEQPWWKAWWYDQEWTDFLDHRQEDLTKDFNLKDKASFFKIEALDDLPLWVVFALMGLVFLMLVWMIYRVWKKPVTKRHAKAQKLLIQLMGRPEPSITWQQHYDVFCAAHPELTSAHREQLLNLIDRLNALLYHPSSTEDIALLCRDIQALRNHLKHKKTS